MNHGYYEEVGKREGPRAEPEEMWNHIYVPLLFQEDVDGKEGGKGW